METLYFITWAPSAENVGKVEPLKAWYNTAWHLLGIMDQQEFHGVPGWGSQLHWHMIVYVKDKIAFYRRLYKLRQWGFVKIKVAKNIDKLMDYYFIKNLNEAREIIGIEDCWITNNTKRRELTKWVKDIYFRTNRMERKYPDILDYLNG